MSPFLTEIRAMVGNHLLVLPSVAVLPWDSQGRVLLVRQADSGQWATIGGAVEPDETSQSAAAREAAEEAGIGVELARVRAVLGGPGLRVRYPNGDQTSYVTTVFDARVVSGDPRPDGDEILDVAWFTPSRLAEADLHPVGKCVLQGAGIIPVLADSTTPGLSRSPGEAPVLVLVTGLQVTGKSTLGAIAGDHLGAAVLAWD